VFLRFCFTQCVNPDRIARLQDYILPATSEDAKTYDLAANQHLTVYMASAGLLHYLRLVLCRMPMHYDSRHLTALPNSYQLQRCTNGTLGPCPVGSVQPFSQSMVRQRDIAPDNVAMRALTTLYLHGTAVMVPSGQTGQTSSISSPSALRKVPAISGNLLLTFYA
jgi:hypothetical protein